MIWQFLEVARLVWGLLNRLAIFLFFAVVAGWLIHEYGVVSGLLVLLLAVGVVVRNLGAGRR